MVCLLLCFCGILQRMAEGLPQQTLLGQRYRTPLSAKVFSSWDFCIRVWEAATIKKHEISNELKVCVAKRTSVAGDESEGEGLRGRARVCPV